MRWTVERTKDNFETVLAKYATVNYGVLFFHNARYPSTDSDNLVIAYASGKWETFFPEED